MQAAIPSSCDAAGASSSSNSNSNSSAATPYGYVVTSQRPTAVQHAITCSFTAPGAKNLILARLNRIEVFTVTPEGLVPVVEVPIFGSIVSLSHYRPHGSVQDVLYILTAKKYFCVLGYDANSGRVTSRATGNLRDRVGRDSPHGPRGFLDPDGRMIAMILYDRTLKIIPIESNGMREAFNVRIEESRIIDACFLHGCDRPTICVLYEPSRGTRSIKTYTVDSRGKVLAAGPWSKHSVECTGHMLIPAPKPFRGVCLVGRTSVSYIDSRTGSVQTISFGADMYATTFGQIDEIGSRYLIGDQRGNLFVLVLLTDPSQEGSVRGLALEHLGETSVASSLCYLDNGVVFVGSAIADSQLIRLRPQTEVEATGPDALTPVVEVLATYNNVGPILDMCVVQKEGHGQPQIVTCSGASKSACINIVRGGVGVHEQASIELEGVKRLWSLRASDASPFDAHLVESFALETRILSINDNELEEGHINGFIDSEPTIYCGNLIGDKIVQITPSSVTVLSGNGVLSCYKSPDRITVGVANFHQIAIATASSEVIYFEVGAAGASIVTRVKLDHDVACLSVRPIPVAPVASGTEGVPPIPPAFGAGDSMVQDSTAGINVEESVLYPSTKSTVLAVGMWTDDTVRLLALPSLTEITRAHLQSDVQVRDVCILHHVEDVRSGEEGEGQRVGLVSFLVAGMGDGSVITFSIQTALRPANNEISAETLIAELSNPVLAKYALTGRRRVVLGTRPISFASFQSGDKLCIFASSNRPTIIYVKNSQLLFSMVNADEVSSVAPFHSALFPDCLAMASDSRLMVCTLDTIQRVHIEKVNIDAEPSKICYANSVGVYGVLTRSFTPTAKAKLAGHNVTFLDADMNKIFTFDLEPLEQGMSIAACSFYDEDASKASKQFIVVGTAYVVPNEIEPSKGRILVFAIDSPERGVDVHADGTDANNVSASAMELTDGAAHMASVSLVCERATKAAVFSLVTAGGRLVAGIGAKIQVFRWEVPSETLASPELKAECGHHGHTLALFLKARGSMIALGDLMQSITVINYDEAAHKLEEEARDFNCNYMRAIEILSDSAFVGAEDHGNMFLVEKEPEGETKTGRLLHFGEFHVGDLINVFRHGTLSNHPMEQSQPAVAVAGGVGAVEGSIASLAAMEEDGSSAQGKQHEDKPLVHFEGSLGQSVLFGTVSGAIGTLLLINEASYTFLKAVEVGMESAINSVGGLSHKEWRSFSNDRKCGDQVNVIDGDLVERFLELSPADKARVVLAINNELSMSTGAGQESKYIGALTVEECCARIEEVSQCH